MKTEVLNHNQILRICNRFAFQIVENSSDINEILIIGIKSKGYEIAKIVKKQIERVKRYVADEGITALPVIVTLHQEGTRLVENVPIVPIMKLPSFLDEFVGNLGSLKSIEK